MLLQCSVLGLTPPPPARAAHRRSYPPMASRMLLIVGSCEPLYEAEFTQSNAPKQSEETAHLNQFILHSAMDMVDMAMEEKADMCASRPRPFSPR